MGKRKPSYTVGENVIDTATMEISMEFSKNRELFYDPTIPLLVIHPEKTLIWKDMYAAMFIPALFRIAKVWRQPKCALTDEWIKKKMWCVYYNGILLNHKIEWNNAIWSYMDGPRDYNICEVREHDIIYMWNLKKWYK